MDVTPVEGVFVEKDSKEKKWEKVNGEFRCAYEGCGKVYSRRQSVWFHFQDKHTDKALNRNNNSCEKETICCDLCDKTFTTKRGASMHRASFHQGIYQYTCGICGKGFSSNQSYRSHVYKHAGIALLCAACNKTFATETTLKRHQQNSCIGRTLTPEDKVHQCDVCGNQFTSSSALTDHKKAFHEGICRYSCVCGKSFKWRSSLKKHKSICCTPAVNELAI